MGIPLTEKRTNDTIYEKAKTNINNVSKKMDQELQTLKDLHNLESDDTIKSITESLHTLQDNITFTNRNQLEQAWDKFALRTSNGAKAFLKLIQQESGGQAFRYFNMVVMATQTLLREKGFLKNGDQTAGTEWIDGIRGPVTKDAVLNFKKEWNEQHPHDRFDTTGDLRYNIGKKMIQALLKETQTTPDDNSQTTPDVNSQTTPDVNSQTNPESVSQTSESIIKITPSTELKQKTIPNEQIQYLLNDSVTAIILAGEQFDNSQTLQSFMTTLGGTSEWGKLTYEQTNSINQKVGEAIVYQKLQNMETQLNSESPLKDTTLQNFLTEYCKNIQKIKDTSIKSRMDQLVINKLLTDTIPAKEDATPQEMKALKDKYQFVNTLGTNDNILKNPIIKTKLESYTKEISYYETYWKSKINSLNLSDFINHKKVLNEAFKNYDDKGKVKDNTTRHFTQKKSELSVQNFDGKGILTLYNKVATNQLTLEKKNTQTKKKETRIISPEIDNQSEWHNILTGQQAQYQELYKQIVTNNQSNVNWDYVLYGTSQTSN